MHIDHIMNKLIQLKNSKKIIPVSPIIKLINISNITEVATICSIIKKFSNFKSPEPITIDITALSPYKVDGETSSIKIVEILTCLQYIGNKNILVGKYINIPINKIVDIKIDGKTTVKSQNSDSNIVTIEVNKDPNKNNMQQAIITTFIPHTLTIILQGVIPVIPVIPPPITLDKLMIDCDKLDAKLCEEKLVSIQNMVDNLKEKNIFIDVKRCNDKNISDTVSDRVFSSLRNEPYLLRQPDKCIDETNIVNIKWNDLYSQVINNNFNNLSPEMITNINNFVLNENHDLSRVLQILSGNNNIKIVNNTITICNIANDTDSINLVAKIIGQICYKTEQSQILDLTCYKSGVENIIETLYISIDEYNRDPENTGVEVKINKVLLNKQYQKQQINIPTTYPIEYK